MVRLIESNLDGVLLFRVFGNLMAGDLSPIENRFDALAVEEGVRAVVDMSRADAMTTPAITILLRTSREISKRGGKFVLANLPRAIARMFTCCRLDVVFDVAGDVDEAIERVRGIAPSSATASSDSAEHPDWRR
jgi:anti-anti-sigma factor